MSHPRDALAAVLTAEPVDLARGALAIAHLAYPTLDPAPSLRALDALAAGVAPRLHGLPPAAAATVLFEYLVGECGFRGNQRDYYDPRNSFLNDVLERRTGIPITLAVVLLETGARCGLGLEGVGFPGHFLVRAGSEPGAVLLDPFFGRPVDAGELLARYRALALRRPGPAPERVPPEALVATGPRAILARMLRNLVQIHIHRDEPQRALGAVDLALTVTPDSPEDVGVRGALYERLECFTAALADFQRYLALAPDAPDAARVQRRVAALARAVAAIQ